MTNPWAGDKGRKEALRRIAEAKRNKATELDLGGLALEEVPEEIFALSQLRALYLGFGEEPRKSAGYPAYIKEKDKVSCNAVHLLPPHLFSALPHLVHLDLGGNRLTTLPDTIGNLNALKRLYLNGNRLGKLPDAIGKLNALEKLHLNNNLLTALPDLVSNLTTLTILNLNANQLTALPDEIGKLNALTFLHLDGNELTALPETIGSLNALNYLSLTNNQLTALPDSIGNLTALDKLTFSYNQLTALPESIGNLNELTDLTLFGNQLTALPDTIGNLTALKSLFLDRSQLTVLPETIGNLTALQGLSLSGNRLTELPETIGNLTALTALYLDDNRLTTLPDTVGNFNVLDNLFLQGNQLTELPETIGRLNTLQSLELQDNPLPRLYFDNLEQGIPELFAYIASLSTAKEIDGGVVPIREAKLLLTGEGEVGKTFLIRALRGEISRNKADEEADRKESTFGVELGRLEVPLAQPMTPRGGLEIDRIDFNTWDFGGQKDYRILHQFFFSGDAVYLLVWKPRMGETQCDLTGWLRRIYLVAGDSARVVLVATHCDDEKQRYDASDILRDVPEKLTRLIRARIEVDSITGKNLDDLKRVIGEVATAEATRLPRLGNKMNAQWRDVINEMLDPDERPSTLAYDTFCRRCEEKGLSKEQAETLASVFLHELGRALYFGGQKFGDKEPEGHDRFDLSNLLVLDPEWLSKAITRVLQFKPLTDAGGLLKHDMLDEVWADKEGEPHYPTDAYGFLVRLMQKLDVSYPVKDQHGNVSIIAQRLPQTAPRALPWRLDSQPAEGETELRLQCDVDDDVPGLIPWLIAETHIYQVDDPNDETGRTLSWADGAFLRTNTETGGYEALLQLTRRPQHRLHLVVRGSRPHVFFNELQRVIINVLKRWEGLEHRYYVPCPEIRDDGTRCRGRHPLQTLSKVPPEVNVDRCDAGDPHYNDINKLVVGLDTQFIAKRRDFEDAVTEATRPVREDIAQLRESSINAWQTLLMVQNALLAPCPRLFTIVPVGPDVIVPEAVKPSGGLLKPIVQLFTGGRDETAAKMVGQHYHLQLFCEQSHIPVGEPYLIYKEPEWFKVMVPLLRLVAPVLGIIKSTTGDPDLVQQIEGAQDFMSSIGSDDDRALHYSKGSQLMQARDADYRQLQALLQELDPNNSYRGMKQRIDTTGRVLWMSPSEAAFHQPIEIHVPGSGVKQIGE